LTFWRFTNLIIIIIIVMQDTLMWRRGGGGGGAAVDRPKRSRVAAEYQQNKREKHFKTGKSYFHAMIGDKIYICVNNLPKVVKQLCPGGNLTHHLLIASPTPCRFASLACSSCEKTFVNRRQS